MLVARTRQACSTDPACGAYGTQNHATTCVASSLELCLCRSIQSNLTTVDCAALNRRHLSASQSCIPLVLELHEAIDQCCTCLQRLDSLSGAPGLTSFLQLLHRIVRPPFNNNVKPSWPLLDWSIDNGSYDFQTPWPTAGLKSIRDTILSESISQSSWLA